MKSIPEFLRDADPLRHESTPSWDKRDYRRIRFSHEQMRNCCMRGYFGILDSVALGQKSGQLVLYLLLSPVVSRFPRLALLRS